MGSGDLALSYSRGLPPAPDGSQRRESGAGIRWPIMAAPYCSRILAPLQHAPPRIANRATTSHGFAMVPGGSALKRPASGWKRGCKVK